MVNPTIQQELLAHLDQLAPDQQQQLLEFARTLSQGTPQGTPGQALLPFAGAIEPDDLQAIARAIEEGCEEVRSDDW